MRILMMNDGALSRGLTICPQCGEDWSEHHGQSARGMEFCPRCGSPVHAFGYDPLRRPIYGVGGGSKMGQKWIVRAGVVGLGLMSGLSGLLLVYGGWFDPHQMDVVQLWISRIGGPALLAQGAVYTWFPFRRPAPTTAKIIPFRRNPCV